MFFAKGNAVRQAQTNWQPVVAYVLWDGRPRSFAELKNQIDGIPQHTLTLTLRQLELGGLVVHNVYGTMPPAVQYALTRKGRQLLEMSLAKAEKAHQTE